MSRQLTIEQKLQKAFKPIHLEVINESQMHNVPEGSESHFKVVIVTEQFRGKMLVARHRSVNQLLAEEFNSGLHALALHTMTPEEHSAKEGEAPDSPPCLGGGKQ